MAQEPTSSPKPGLVSRIDAFVGLAGRAVSWLVLGLVCLVAFNVLARYLFSIGTVALQELEWHLLAVTALIGMSYGINRGDEVRVDMLYARYGPRTKALVEILSAALMLLVALYLAYVSLSYVNQSYRFVEGSPDPGGLSHRFILKSFIPIGFILLALQSVVEIAKGVGRFRAAAAGLTDRGTSH
jgi:TRAP-type mannitol/chloroaromatic compound transport system permease small subunit